MKPRPIISFRSGYSGITSGWGTEGKWREGDVSHRLTNYRLGEGDNCFLNAGQITHNKACQRAHRGIPKNESAHHWNGIVHRVNEQGCSEQNRSYAPLESNPVDTCVRCKALLTPLPTCVLPTLQKAKPGRPATANSCARQPPPTATQASQPDKSLEKEGATAADELTTDSHACQPPPTSAQASQADTPTQKVQADGSAKLTIHSRA